MKKKVVIVFTLVGAAVVCCMSVILSTGCEKTLDQKINDAHENIANVKQDLQEAQSGFLKEWKTFKDEAETAIAVNEKRIDSLKEKIGKADVKLKTKYGKDLAMLERKNRGLKKRLENYKDEGENKWEEFKTNFTHDMDGVGKTLKDLFDGSN